MHFAVGIVLTLCIACCSQQDKSTANWHVVHRDLPEALLSVWGTSATDVWTVGSDVGEGPLVMHFDGEKWNTMATGQRGDLWWVTGLDDGSVFMGGAEGMILQYKSGVFSRMNTPGDGIVFGIWGSSPEQMWAVGGKQGGASGAFAWRREGDDWVSANDFPAAVSETDALWKVHGRTANDVWMVGTDGLALHWNGTELTQDNIPTGESIFTLDANSEGFVAVGGFGTGQIFENRDGQWLNVSPMPASEPLIGVSIRADVGYAVGHYGSVLRRDEMGSWAPESTGLSIFQGLHAVWIDPQGGVWAVGGHILSIPLTDAVMLYRGREIPGSENQ